MKNLLLLFVFSLLFISCQSSSETKPLNLDDYTWEDILAEGQAQDMTMMMWKGDPKINAYMQKYIKPKLLKKHNINLTIVDGQGNYIVQMLMAELQADASTSEIDLIWINGETFYQLRQIDALFGPWTSELPNADKIDFENPFIGKDFQQAIDGYEMPWGNVQMTLIYNQDKIKQPPQTRAELLSFVKEHPGKFTWDNHFTGLTFMKALLMDIAGGPKVLEGEFNEDLYAKYSDELWVYLNQLKPYLWRQGEVFPENVAQMHQLFANGELLFTMSINDAEVDNKVEEGLFQKTSRAYVPEFGTIQNSHYLGISKLSEKKLTAMLVVNELISEENQLEKMKPSVWGDGTVLQVSKLDSVFQKKFNSIAQRNYAPPREDIQQKALPELAPEYMIRLAEDFKKNLID
jgi:putative spermidine/putrescine transport system substrate-binding protein